jgi:transcriptional regulator with XRE-family HTH domain
MESTRSQSETGPLGPSYTTVADLEAELGTQVRLLRLDRNLDQATLAERAGVSLSSVRRLELGHGSTTHTLISVLRALGREEWLKTVAPVATINPLTMPRTAQPRQRAAGRRKG